MQEQPHRAVDLAEGCDVEKCVCHTLSVAAPFRQPKGGDNALTDGRLNEAWSVPTVDDYSAIRRQL